MTPNLFVVGAPKAGTTTLFDILKDSKDIYTPNTKEIHYLSRSSVIDSYYNPVIPKSDTEYFSLFNHASSERYRLDCSPSYLYSNDALEYIGANKKTPKVVIMLRDPVERSISHYSMDLSKGFINVAIKNVLNDPNNYPQHFNEYITLSKYEDYVPMWIKKLGKDNVLIIKTEDFKSHQQKVLSALAEFLDINLDKLNINSINSNSAFLPRNNLVIRARQSKLLFKSYQAMPSWLKDLVTKATTKPLKEKPVSSDEKKQLSNILTSSVEFYQSVPESF